MSAPGEVAAIVLAAGRGTRFGESPKLLAALDGKPLVRHAVETSLAAGLRTIVVLGHKEAEIRAALADLPVAVVSNPAFADGLSTSLKAGFAALPVEAEGALVLLGDMPRLSPALLLRLVATWSESGRPNAVIPVAGGRRGNPVLLSRRLSAEIAKLTGDAGAGPLLRATRNVMEIPIAEEGVLLDVDTPETLAEIAPLRAT